MAALAVDRIAAATPGAVASLRAVHVTPPRATAGLVGRRHVGGAVVAVRRGRRAGAGLACRSSVKPLGGSNGNVVEFQSGMCVVSYV